MSPFLRCLSFLMLPLLSTAQRDTSVRPQTGSWGDQGNGTYINPVLYADYSDPDVIRVGDEYYMVCSEFAHMGMPVLRSEDMVNWTIIGQVFSRLDFPEYDRFQRYGRGSWAPAIRYHDHRFYLYFCTPDEGLFMTTATNAAGPWAPLIRVHAGPKWEDPCPFWDEHDGQAYLGHSRTGAGPIIIHKMSADGTTLLDSGVTVYTGPTAEGTKIFQVDSFYYISIPEGGVSKGWQTVLRSRSIYGPYEKKVVLERGSTGVNGPHQGALVATAGGQWWFYHFQSDGAMGRVLHLQPVLWQEGWPLIGADLDHNGIGEPVYVWKKPDIPGRHAIHAPQTDDEFAEPLLGFQWESNHNREPSAWSLSKKPGWLCLDALQADSFFHARNTFTQKIMGATGTVTVRMDPAGMSDGQQAGLCAMSSVYALVGVRKKEGRGWIFFDDGGKGNVEKEIRTGIVYLRMQLRIKEGNNQCLYSIDGKNWQSLGSPFETKFGFWKGTRVGLFSYNTVRDGGTAAFDWFHYDYDGPKYLVIPHPAGAGRQ
jgi:beta-xylosidase